MLVFPLQKLEGAKQARGVFWLIMLFTATHNMKCVVMGVKGTVCDTGPAARGFTDQRLQRNSTCCNLTAFGRPNDII